MIMISLKKLTLNQGKCGKRRLIIIPGVDSKNEESKCDLTLNLLLQWIYR